MNPETTQPVLKGYCDIPSMPTARGKIAIWADGGSSTGQAHLYVNMMSGFQCITDVWLSWLRAGMRVTLDGEEWQLRQFEQFPSPHPNQALPLWGIKLELEK
jgi:hypothetical protein